MKSVWPKMIVLWHSAFGAIPTGWILCDGTLNTPDLRDNFIVGAGNTYTKDDTGGAVNHTHTFTGDGHSHGLASGTDLSPGASYSAILASAPITGTTNAEPHLPPYHALYYIMKT